MQSLPISEREKTFFNDFFFKIDLFSFWHETRNLSL